MFTYPVLSMAATGQNLRDLIVRKGLKVGDIQKQLGFASPQAVYHWLAGETIPSIDSLYALSELLCVPLDSLVVGDRKARFFWCSCPQEFRCEYRNS